MKISIGTKSDQKIASLKKMYLEVFESEADVSPYAALSNVAEAPLNSEIYQGALNRANYCKNQSPVKLCIGLESGLAERNGIWFEETWAVALYEDKKYFGYSSGMTIPRIVIERMKEEDLTHDLLMERMDAELNQVGSRDTWGRYTNGQLSRIVSIEEAIRNVLIQLHEDTLYQK